MLYEEAEFAAHSEEVAQKMKSVLKGVIAYETLWSEGSEPMKALMQNVKVSHEGKNVGFTWKGESDQVVSAMDDLFSRLETWKPLLMKNRRSSTGAPHPKK